MADDAGEHRQGDVERTSMLTAAQVERPVRFALSRDELHFRSERVGRSAMRNYRAGIALPQCDEGFARPVTND